MKKKIIKKSHNMYIKNPNAYTYEGESIENKVDRILDSKEPISDGAPIIYTEKKDGVLPQFDIRTDKWELAQDAMDKVNKAKIAKGQSPNGEIENPQTAADATTEQGGNPSAPE